jgi:hypothetical protein
MPLMPGSEEVRKRTNFKREHHRMQHHVLAVLCLARSDRSLTTMVSPWRSLEGESRTVDPSDGDCCARSSRGAVPRRSFIGLPVLCILPKKQFSDVDIRALET